MAVVGHVDGTCEKLTCSMLQTYCVKTALVLDCEIYVKD